VASTKIGYCIGTGEIMVRTLHLGALLLLWVGADAFSVGRHGRAGFGSSLLQQRSRRLQDKVDITQEIGYVTPNELVFPEDMSDEWEIDCYSRPVTGDDGKKLWEVLITDSEGTFRYLKPLASNLVNSRNLRKVVEDVLEEAPVPPRTIRFFRNQMYNMISIALSTIDVVVKPSRRTSNLFMWLQEREDHIYPQMSGYNPQLKQQTILDYDVSQPDRLPDVLKAESYAFVALPAEVFWDKQVNSDNIKKGSLCPIRGMPKTGWIHGITLLSKRSPAIAAWMDGIEIGTTHTHTHIHIHTHTQTHKHTYTHTHIHTYIHTHIHTYTHTHTHTHTHTQTHTDTFTLTISTHSHIHTYT
jgi:hypothetical protein